MEFRFGKDISVLVMKFGVFISLESCKTNIGTSIISVIEHTFGPCTTLMNKLKDFVSKCDRSFWVRLTIFLRKSTMIILLHLERYIQENAVATSYKKMIIHKRNVIMAYLMFNVGVLLYSLF
jgi:hypothetical protein